jgi:UDP-glucose-4-epimerase GalE
MTTILVIGGAGYIGSQCCKHLHDTGYVPVVLDNLCTGHREFVRWGPYEDGDVRNQQRVLDVIDRHKPAAIMHFAARSLVEESVKRPDIYYENNISGTLTLLKCMRDRGIDKLIFSSTCAIYGDQDDALITEASPKSPLSPYGFSKLACEQMMDDFDRAYGIRSVRLRYFNAAGADPQTEIGEHHTPETHLIPLLLDVALGLNDRLRVYGDDYPTPDGSAIRDYIHVTDLATAHQKALEYLIAERPSAALNIGTGKGNSVLEVVRVAETVTGRAIRMEIADRRPGGAAVLVADPVEARRRLGWSAEHSDIAEILSDAWRWHQKRFALSSS